MPRLKKEPLGVEAAPEPADDAGRRTRGLLLGILCLALLIRLLHFWMIAGTPLPKHHLTASETDDHAFFQWAQSIVGGDWLGRDTYHPYFGWMQEIAPLETWYRWWGGKEIFHQAPLYPYVLAGLLKLFRGSVPLALMAQLAIGALQALVTYRLAALLFDPWVGLAAAALTAPYGPFIFYEGLLLRDWLPPILEPLALLALLHARKKGGGYQWGVAGGALGLALLAKELLATGKQEEARHQVALAETAYAQYYPRLSYPNYNLGLLYLKLGEATKARSFLERFLALEPSGSRSERVRALLATLETAKGG